MGESRMKNDSKDAFGPLEGRATAMADPDIPDRISLRDHLTTVEIGAFQVERGTTQRLRFDVVVEVLPASEPLNDDVDRILSYDTLTEAIAYELAAERLNLLETLAERVAERILLEPQAIRVFVRIEKLDRGPGALGVEIVRQRVVAAEPVEENPVHPLVIYLKNPTINDQSLPRWIDLFVKQDAPVILCVGLPDQLPVQTGHAPTQRRIDLLEIEQNAWLLASRDPRCVVVDSRTELDWAMKQGKLSVWAPSKIVLDAVDGPPAGAGGMALAAWLADQLAAVQLLVIDDVAPDPAVFQQMRKVTL